MTPRIMRLVPAIAGILMIPAIYFLSRQMFGRRVSLLAATLCCFSAFLLVYSRDAKMYMHFWLMCTLHVGTLLWWLRARTWTSWLCWVATGIAMLALHGLGGFIFLTTVLICVTTPRGNWRHFLTIGAFFGWLVALPVLAFFQLSGIAVSALRARREAHGFEVQATATPVTGSQDQTTGEQAGADVRAPSSVARPRVERVLMSRPMAVVSWPPVAKASTWRPLREVAEWPLRAWPTFRWPPLIFFALGMVIILSSMKGPLGYYDNFNDFDRVVDARDSFDVGDAGVAWVGPYNLGRKFNDLVLFTTSAYLTGWEWPRHFPEAGPEADQEKWIAPRTLKLLKGGTISILGLLAIGLIPWRKLICPGRARVERIEEEVCVRRSFIRRRPLWLGVWIVVTAFTVYAVASPRPASVLDAVAKVALQAPPTVTWPRLEKPLAGPEHDYSNLTTWQTVQQWWENTKGEYHRYRDFYKAPERRARFQADYTAARTTYGSAFHSGNIATTRLVVIGSILFALTVMLVWRRLWRPTLHLWIAITVVVTLLVILSLLPQFATSSIWMPRYLGVIFPAVMIVAAALIARQPARWLQALTLVVFIVVNMGQFGARVLGQTEAPIDRMAADIIRSQPKSRVPSQPEKPTFRAYLSYPSEFRGAPPGKASALDPAGNYYLRILSGVKSDPRGIRRGFYAGNFRIWQNDTQTIIDDIRRSPEIERFVVWSGVEHGQVDLTDVIGERLQGRFERVGDESFEAHDHWTWYHWWTFRRREYVRSGRPTPPATAAVPSGN
jgi:4-amino-4-deoxy-L-arabinose transferase-like glycosyltransferase